MMTGTTTAAPNANLRSRHSASCGHGTFKGVFRTVALSLALTLIAVACGGADEGTPSAEAGNSTSDALKVGVILVGPKNDNSFNQAAYQGVVNAAADYPNIELTATLESRATSESQIDAIRTLAPINDVVIGNGSEFGARFEAEADNFPDTTFLTIGGYPPNHHANVYSIAYDRVAGYVTGVVGAHLTESKIIGFVGGADIPPVNQSMIGFIAGIESVDPDIRILTNVIGDFDDVAKAKEATAAMIAEGADVVNAYLNAGAVGAYRAADESGEDIAIFKVDLHECESYSNIIGANIGDNTASSYTLLTSFADGTLAPEGVTIFAGLQDPAIQRVEYCPPYADDEELMAIAQATVDGINSGEIELPPEELNPRPEAPYREGFDGEVVNPK